MLLCALCWRPPPPCPALLTWCLPRPALPVFRSTALQGTMEALEKSYFRLTSAPDPAGVRPERVLRAALARLVGLLRRREVNYFYALDQFKVGGVQWAVVFAVWGVGAVQCAGGGGV